MSESKPTAGGRDFARVIRSGMAIAFGGVLLITAQLAEEIYVKTTRFGPSYVGLDVLLIGAGLVAIACIAAAIPVLAGRHDGSPP